MRAHRVGCSESLLRRIFPSRLREVVVVTLLAACWLAAQSQKPAATTSRRLAEAIDRTLDKGKDAILPPTVSHMLGISPQAHEVPVKQFAIMGEPIRGFDVSPAEHNNVVIFVESRAKNETTFYLASRKGVLRRVLSVREGAGYPRQPTHGDKEAFDKEKQYWVDQLVKHP